MTSSTLLKSSEGYSRIFGGLLYLQMTLVLLLGLPAAQGFLFPDMALHSMHRSGGNSVYVIAGLQEEPYLNANGTGYLPDLMNALAAKYSRLKNGSIKFNYEIVPVKNWDDLLKRAESEHVQLAFGLVCPYILRTDPKYKGMHTSLPIVHTSVKYVTGSHDDSDWSENMAPPPWKVPKLINIKGSPEDRLLEAKKKLGIVQRHRGRQQQQELDLETLQSAVEYIRGHGDDYLVTDASVADCIVSKEGPDGLQSVCPSRRLSHSGHLYYGFFGRNANLLKFINDLLKLLQRNGKLDALEFKYFDDVEQCD